MFLCVSRFRNVFFSLNVTKKEQFIAYRDTDS